MADLRIEALDYARRLTATLEQYNANSAGDAAQVKRLEGHLIEARDELAYAYNLIKNRSMRAPGESYRTDLLNEIAGLVDRDVRREIGSDHAATKQQLHTLEQAAERAIGILNGEPVPPPPIGAPLTRLEEAALSAKGAARRAEEIGRVQRELSEARAELDRARVVAAADLETLRSRDAQIDQMAADLAKLTSRASIAEAASREKGKELEKVRRDLEQARAAASFASATLRGEPVGRIVVEGVPLSLLECAALDARREIDRLRADLRKEHQIKAFVNDECQRVRAALGLDPMSEIGAVVAAVKGLNDVIKYLRIEHQDRADELAAAEAEIAKCKPLIDAVKHSAVFATCGQWVELRTWETEHTGDDATPTELKATYIDAGVLWL